MVFYVKISQFLLADSVAGLYTLGHLLGKSLGSLGCISGSRGGLQTPLKRQQPYKARGMVLPHRQGNRCFCSRFSKSNIPIGGKRVSSSKKWNKYFFFFIKLATIIASNHCLTSFSFRFLPSGSQASSILCPFWDLFFLKPLLIRVRLYDCSWNPCKDLTWESRSKKYLGFFTTLVVFLSTVLCR